MPIDSGGEVGPTEQAYIQQRIATPQLNHREGRPEHDAGRPCIPRRSGASSRVWALRRRRTRIPQRRRRSVRRRPSPAVWRSHRATTAIVHVAMNRAMRRCGEAVEDRLPGKEVQQQARCPGSRRSHRNSRHRPRCQRPCCARYFGNAVVNSDSVAGMINAAPMPATARATMICDRAVEESRGDRRHREDRQADEQGTAPSDTGRRSRPRAAAGMRAPACSRRRSRSVASASRRSQRDVGQCRVERDHRGDDQ